MSEEQERIDYWALVEKINEHITTHKVDRDELLQDIEWECNKCKWSGIDIVEKELTEDELMKYMDEKGEGMA